MTNTPISLYIHIPFCVKKCAYCAFFSVAPKAADDNILDSYTDAVIKRIRSMPKHDIKTVYFGGGTPTVLGASRLCRIIDAVRSTHDLEKNAEITLEANPGTVINGEFALYSAAGFNRLSLGLQSADDGILKTIGRIHGLDGFLKCYDEAARYFSNISVDMIFALPGGGVEKTLQVINNIHPAHVSAYSLTLEENTPLYRNRKNYVFPGEEEEEAEYSFICSFLSESGYAHYEISSFALPGRESQHNLVYWNRGDYIGIGPAAHSFYNNRRFSTPADISLFIKNAEFPFLTDTNFTDVKEIPPAEAEEERIMLGLRTSKGVSLPDGKIAKAKSFAAAGYGKLEGNVFSLNDKGFRVSNSIITELI